MTADTPDGNIKDSDTGGERIESSAFGISEVATKWSIRGLELSTKLAIKELDASTTIAIKNIEFFTKLEIEKVRGDIKALEASTKFEMEKLRGEIEKVSERNFRLIVGMLLVQTGLVIVAVKFF